jgi:DNA mismatch repair protein MutL
MDQRYAAAKKELEPQEQRKIVAGFYEMPTQQPVMNIAPPITAAPPEKLEEPNIIVNAAVEKLQNKPYIVTFTDRTAPQVPFIASLQAKSQPDTTPKFTVIKPEPIKTEVPAEILCIGEIFNTYIIAQCADEVYFIDKHAAHERLIFDTLTKKSQSESQPLLVECIVSLDRQDKTLILDEMDTFVACGFELEDYGGNAIMVRAIPPEIAKEDIAAILEHAAANLADNRTISDKRTKILESMACKSAVKGGQYSHQAEQQALIDRLFAIPDIKYCPHGRPIIYTMHKKDFEKMFKRIV